MHAALTHFDMQDYSQCMVLGQPICWAPHVNTTDYLIYIQCSMFNCNFMYEFWANLVEKCTYCATFIYGLKILLGWLLPGPFHDSFFVFQKNT